MQVQPKEGGDEYRAKLTLSSPEHPTVAGVTPRAADAQPSPKNIPTGNLNWEGNGQKSHADGWENVRWEEGSLGEIDWEYQEIEIDSSRFFYATYQEMLS